MLAKAGFAGRVNVARVLATLGAAPTLLAVAGGNVGALFEDLVDRTAIRARIVPVAGRTRIAFIAHDAASGLEYRFVPEGPDLSGTERDAALAAFLALLTELRPRWVVLSGSLPRGVPPDTYARMSRSAREAGARVAIDTSGGALALALREGAVDLAKPSLRELEGIAGAPLDEDGVRRAAERLVADGSSARVAVTLGMQGSLLATRQGTLRRPALHVPVHSATGAGDSFLAGFVHGLDRGLGDGAAFALALGCGAAAVMTAGTELCRGEDVDRLLAAGGRESRQAAEAIGSPAAGVS